MGDTTVLLVPVLDERATVDDVVALADAALRSAVVDHVLVVDGGSTDGTPQALRAAGLEVLDAHAVRPDGASPEVRGKGDSVWRALSTVEQDRVVLVDGDVHGLTVDDVRALRDALDDPTAELAKASFDRLQATDGTVRALDGRVTALLAKPVLARWAPDLDHVRVPLSGQQAARTATLRRLPLLSHYGLEIGLLLEVRRRFGARAVVDVPISSISHDEKTDARLVPMAHQVLAAAAWGLGLDAEVGTEVGAGVALLPPLAARTGTSR